MVLQRIRRIFRDPLSEALDWIEERGVMPNHVDWIALRRDAKQLAGSAPIPAGRRRAIRMVLERIGDRHGQVLAAEDVSGFRAVTATGTTRGLGLLAVYPERVVVHVFAGGPAERAGVRVGDVVENVNGHAPQSLGQGPLLDLGQHAPALLSLYRSRRAETVTVRLEPDQYQATGLPSGRELVDNILYIALPSTAKNMAAEYLSSAHQAVRELDREATRGWIVDLRQNMGGDLYLMLAAAGPIVGDGELGGLVDARGVRTRWFYRDGAVLLGERRRIPAIAAVGLCRPLCPVAVLTSCLTASAGEALAVAFRKRPRTRSFGGSTAGVPTGLEDKKLGDGTLLRCSTALYTDRTGQRYDGPIAPDQTVQADWTLVGTDNDPVLITALQWLRSQQDDARPGAIPPGYCDLIA